MDYRTLEETLKNPIFSGAHFAALEGLTAAAKILNRNGSNPHAVDLLIDSITLLTDQTKETNNKIENQLIVEKTLKDLKIKPDNEASQ